MFHDINFRYTDAEEEKLYSPELINEAYVDINGIMEQIARPEKFIVIGPKGAGKTALSSKLLLMGQEQWDLFATSDELEQFEYSLLEKTGAAKGTLAGGSVTVWQMLLAIRLMPLLLQDEQIRNANPKLAIFNLALKKYGFATSDSLIHIVQYTSRRGMFSKLKSAISEVRGEKTEEEQFKVKDPAAVLEAIKDVYRSIEPSESKYYLVIDGIDHPLRRGKNNAPYIADLINGVRLLNVFFAELGISAKAIILIRDEILQLVPDPNLTKRIIDNGVMIKWYDNTRAPLETSLLKILENRAALVGFKATAKSLWKEWFPSTIHSRDSVGFVLDNTRHLPRDVISFFRELQGLGKEPPFSQTDVLAALNNYSDWFLQELSDAIVGIIDENVRGSLVEIFSVLGRTFTVKDLSTALTDHGCEGGKLGDQVARDLFNASWIGNVWETDKGTPRYNWKHRKRTAKLNTKHSLRVHAGLWKALNLI